MMAVLVITGQVAMSAGVQSCLEMTCPTGQGNGQRSLWSDICIQLQRTLFYNQLGKNRFLYMRGGPVRKKKTVWRRGWCVSTDRIVYKIA